MLVLIAAALLATAPADSATAPDSAHARRIVRQFAPVEVTGSRVTDVGAVATVHGSTAPVLRKLAVDRFADAIGLMPGVVVSGQELHVRGGRSGELAMTVAGMPLNDPQFGRPIELPLFAVRATDLMTGPLDADRAGSLAGELDVQTEAPDAKPHWRARWISDRRLDGHYEAAHLGGSTPIPHTGLGIAAAAELHFDDQGLPNVRGEGNFNVLGQSFPLAAENHALAWVKLAPVERPQRGSLEVLTSRVVHAPYDPMFTYEGYVTYVGDFSTLTLSPQPLDESSVYYRAADHLAMTEERRTAVIGSATVGAKVPVHLTSGVLATSSLTSVGLTRSHAYVNPANLPVFGPYDQPGVDAFHVYAGDEPYFREASAWRWLARADAVGSPARGHRLLGGAGVTLDHARLFEIDDGAPAVASVDTVRSYDAGAPGGFAYVQHRWQVGGFIANEGLRVQTFTPGSSVKNAKTRVTLSPRLGFAYPISVRDAFSFAYARIAQDPARDYLYEDRVKAYDRRPLGNGDIVPAEVVMWQAAVKHVLDPEWTTQFSVFMRDVWGEPGVRNIQTSNVHWELQYQSADDAHATGFEVELTREYTRGQRLHWSYTFMNAWGAASSAEGIAYGSAFGPRPLPTGNHPLDWDIEHALGFDGTLRPLPALEVSWAAHLATGRPWTPLYRSEDTSSVWPPLYTDQSEINSKRLPWSETTNLSVRWKPRLLMGATAMLSISNLFDHRGDQLVSIDGFPNSRINTLYDEYAAYRTETGNGGGAYWDGDGGGGGRHWIPVNDPRLRQRPREIRIGVTIGD